MKRSLIITINLLIMGFILFFIIRYANAKADEIYSSLADMPADRSFSDKETGLLDPAVRQFRAAIYAVGNGTMTVDEAVAAYGNIPEE